MLLVLVVAFGFVSFFIAQMFVEKGFRVFCRRRFCESGLFVLFVLGSFCGCSKMPPIWNSMSRMQIR